MPSRPHMPPRQADTVSAMWHLRSRHHPVPAPLPPAYCWSSLEKPAKQRYVLVPCRSGKTMGRLPRRVACSSLTGASDAGAVVRGILLMAGPCRRTRETPLPPVPAGKNGRRQSRWSTAHTSGLGDFPDWNWIFGGKYFGWEILGLVRRGGLLPALVCGAAV